MEELWSVADALLAQGQRLCLITWLVPAAGETRRPGDKALCTADGLVAGTPGVEASPELAAAAAEALATGRPGRCTRPDGAQWFVDVLTPGAHVLVCGAGHIALPLARFALELGFRVTVLDDRPEYAHPDRFPGCRVVAQEFAAALDGMSLGPDDYVVLITRGHEHDVDCLTRVLGQPVAYVGMIGSRRRVRFVFQWLASQGYPQERLDRVFSPIGVAIGAESPEEIAVSIVAELVSVRRKGVEWTLRQRTAARADQEAP